MLTFFLRGCVGHNGAEQARASQSKPKEKLAVFCSLCRRLVTTIAAARCAPQALKQPVQHIVCAGG